MPYSRGKYGDFAYVQLRGDWGRFLFARSMAKENKKVCFKIHCFFSLKCQPSPLPNPQGARERAPCGLGGGDG